MQKKSRRVYFFSMEPFSIARFATNEQIGFFLLAGAVALLTVWVSLLYRRLNQLTHRGTAETLDQTLGKLLESDAARKQFEQEMSAYLLSVEERLRKSIQSIEVVRFNPFEGTSVGGNQSFASAFLNELGSGIVISTLYSRDRISVFGKPVLKFSSSFPLSEEEQKAIAEARAKVGSTTRA